MNYPEKEKLSLYFHIPFCLSKCSYCDFASFANSTAFHEPYINALLKELLLYKSTIDKNQIYDRWGALKIKIRPTKQSGG